jgi:hypothetical protein
MLDSLASHPDPSIDAIYRLQFRGRITTLSGAEGQNLVSDLHGAKRAAPIATPDLRPSPFAPPPDCDPFLARLAEARPDLRARIEERTGRSCDARRRAAVDLGTNLAPLFLHGSCWARLEDRIGGYGDLDRELAWVYLTSDLAPGSTFRHQLVPALADDVFLHGRITRRLEVTTDAGTFRNCVECFYLIDYGIFAWTTETGQELGFSRIVDLGTITYAPGVGPVQSMEVRDLPMPDQHFGMAAGIRLDLIARPLPATAAASAGRSRRPPTPRSG